MHWCAYPIVGSLCMLACTFIHLLTRCASYLLLVLQWAVQRLHTHSHAHIRISCTHKHTIPCSQTLALPLAPTYAHTSHVVPTFISVQVLQWAVQQLDSAFGGEVTFQVRVGQHACM